MTENSQTNPSTNQTKKSPMNPAVMLAVGLVVVVVGSVVAIKTGVVTPPKWLLKTMPASTLPLFTQTAGLSSDEAKLSMMIESGRSGICEISHKDEDEKMTYYIDGDKMKIVINDTINEKPHTTHILTDIEWQYTWVEDETQGTKMKMPSKEEVKEMQKEAEQYLDEQDWDTDWDIAAIEAEEDDRYEINCQYKKVDSSVFDLPTNVEFMDLSEAMQNLDYMDYDAGDYDSINNEDDGYSYSFDKDDLAKMEEWANEMQEKYGIEE